MMMEEEEESWTFLRNKKALKKWRKLFVYRKRKFNVVFFNEFLVKRDEKVNFILWNNFIDVYKSFFLPSQAVDLMKRNSNLEKSLKHF